VPYFALNFLLNHFANLNFDFLLLVLPGAFLPGVRLFNPLVAADLHLAGSFFFLANRYVVLVGNFFLDVFANANLFHLLNRLADGHLVGVGLFLHLALVDGALNFSLHDFRNPNLADTGRNAGATGATGATAAAAATGAAATTFVSLAALFDDAFFPVTLVLADLALLNDGNHVVNVANARTLFFAGNHHGAGDFLFDPDRLADGLLAFTLFAGGHEDLVLVINFFANSLADLANAGLLDPFGYANVNSSLFRHHFGDANCSFDNFPCSRWLAGSGTVVSHTGGTGGCAAATGFFAETAACFGRCRQGDGERHGKNETHSSTLLLAYIQRS